MRCRRLRSWPGWRCRPRPAALARSGQPAISLPGTRGPTWWRRHRPPRRIGLGAIAVNPYDTHPVRIATGLLTLNEYAQGRARIVVGGGGEALQALGIRPERRVRAVGECVEILKGVTPGAPFSFHGQMYQVAELQPVLGQGPEATGLRGRKQAADAAHGRPPWRRHHAVRSHPGHLRRAHRLGARSPARVRARVRTIPLLQLRGLARLHGPRARDPRSENVAGLPRACSAAGC